MIKSVDLNKKLYFLTATFNRQSLTKQSVLDILNQSNLKQYDANIWIVEAGNIEKTKRALKNFKNINFLKVPKNTFWTSAMAYGIREISKEINVEDVMICFNNDIRIYDQILENLLSQVINNDKLVISPLSVSSHDERVVATGVKVKNWFFGINETPFKNQNYKSIRSTSLVDVDFLTQRFMLYQAKLIFEVGNYNSYWLPHYGGDYEFTFRAKKYGYRVVIDPRFKIYIDEKETGLNSVYRSLTFLQRLQSLYSIKSNNNLLKTIKFSLLTAPVISQPLNLIASIAKSLIVALLAKP